MNTKSNTQQKEDSCRKIYGRNVDSDGGVTLSNEKESETCCAECGGTIREVDGESVCQDCGLVESSDRIDRGPDWRAFSNQEYQEKARTGTPTSNTMHDKGLTTNVGWMDKDAYGKSLSAKQRNRAARMRKTSRMNKAKDSKERTLRQAYGEIDRVTTAMSLPESIHKFSCGVFKNCSDNGLLVGRSIEGVVGAVVYAACRIQKNPRTLDDVARVSRVNKERISSAYRHISKELSLEVPPPNPLNYLSRIANQSGATKDTERLAKTLMESYIENSNWSGKNPGGIAAGAIYASYLLLNPDNKLTQGDLNESSGTSVVTIRSRYREMINYLPFADIDSELVNEIEDEVVKKEMTDDKSRIKWVSDMTDTNEIEKQSTTIIRDGNDVSVIPNDDALQSNVMIDAVLFLIDNGLLDAIDLPHSVTRSRNILCQKPENNVDKSATWNELVDGVYLNTQHSKAQKIEYVSRLGDIINFDVELEI